MNDVFVFFLQFVSILDYGFVEEITFIIQNEFFDFDFFIIDVVILVFLREEDFVLFCFLVVELFVFSILNRVGEELIRICVISRKVIKVQEVLDRVKERYKCVLKLLFYFFIKEEFANSNINGIYKKACFDSGKLNFLKILVFSKFLVVLNEEKDKIWRFVKGKIDIKCRVSKFACIRVV